MDLHPDSLRFILGLKLRQLRLERQWGLKDVAQRSGLSVSYLSEIEKGRKYPKPEKLLQLAQGLDVSYDDLVSPKVDESLRLVGELFGSPFLQEFPFHLFGLELEQVAGLITEVPTKAGALLRTFLEIGRSYDVQVEHFLFAALRSYQRMRGNYFSEIEEAAEKILIEKGWDDRRSISEDELRSVLEDEHGYRIDTALLSSYPELADLRSVLVDGERPVLLINERLRPPQRAFALARELGYQVLGHEERSTTSGYLSVDSFEQVTHDFEAAYFSGALLLPKAQMVPDFETFFARDTWSPRAFLDFLDQYRTTPETFFYRLSQLLPAFFDVESSFFTRFAHRAESGVYRLTKLLNMSPLPIPLGVEPSGHYCRRWPGLWLLGQPARAGLQAESVGFEVAAAAQRCRFADYEGDEYLVFSLTRPLSIQTSSHSSVSVAFRLDDALKSKVAFWNDPAIVERDVGVTCERCSFQNCDERAAPPSSLEAEERQEKRQKAFETLVAQVRSGG